MDNEEVLNMRIHNLTFSEKEWLTLNQALRDAIVSDAYFKDMYPRAWELMNRMCYSMAHGTEEGWVSNV